MSGCLQINSGETAWIWESGNKSKANSLLHAVSHFEFIISQVTMMKYISTLKPLSIKQKGDIKIMSFKQTDMSTNLRIATRYQRKHWYRMSSSTSRKASSEPSMLHVVGQQQHQSMSKQEYRRISTKEHSQFL